MQSDRINSALSPVVYEDIALSINTITIIIGPRGLQCETTLYEIMGWESSDVVRFDLEPLLQGQTRTAKLK